jgi:hypothetical protein
MEPVLVQQHVPGDLRPSIFGTGKRPVPKSIKKQEEYGSQAEQARRR